MLVQKSSTILLLILFINSFLRSISSFETFSSGSFYPGWTLSWIPSSCSTMFITLFWGYASSNIFFLSSSFFFLIFSLCSNNLFFRSSWLSTLLSSFLTYFSFTTFSAGGSYFFSSGSLTFVVPRKGGKSFKFEASPAGFSPRGSRPFLLFSFALSYFFLYSSFLFFYSASSIYFLFRLSYSSFALFYSSFFLLIFSSSSLFASSMTFLF